jgi:mannitol/fructose-specific phosphotransferase system IIA component (Ntr-type)
MRIRDILSDDAIIVGIKSDTKKAVLEEMVMLLHEQGKLTDRQKMLEVLLARESLGSTGIGQGIAIPHGKSSVAKALSAACAISKTGVDFDALDDDKVYVIFLLVAPEDPEDVIRVLDQEEKGRKT